MEMVLKARVISKMGPWKPLRLSIESRYSHKQQLYLVGAGGSGSTKVNNGSVELNNCTVGSLYLSGINGEVENSSIVATDCKIGSFSATNRGFVGTASVDLNGCEITEKLNFGAADGCFSSDSGTPDAAVLLVQLYGILMLKPP